MIITKWTNDIMSKTRPPASWLEKALTRNRNAWSGHIQWNLRTRDTIGPKIWSLVERLSLSRRFIHSVISMELKQMSFLERLSLSRRVPYQRFHCWLISSFQLTFLGWSHFSVVLLEGLQLARRGNCCMAQEPDSSGTELKTHSHLRST